jgi:hypothetical protein
VDLGESGGALEGQLLVEDLLDTAHSSLDNVGDGDAVPALSVVSCFIAAD